MAHLQPSVPPQREQARERFGDDVRVLSTDHRAEKPDPAIAEDADVHRELRWYWRDHEFPRLGVRGRVLIRPSGTEPLIRVMVEAASQEDAEAVAHRIAKVVADVYLEPNATKADDAICSQRKPSRVRRRSSRRVAQERTTTSTNAATNPSTLESASPTAASEPATTG